MSTGRDELAAAGCSGCVYAMGGSHLVWPARRHGVFSAGRPGPAGQRLAPPGGFRFPFLVGACQSGNFNRCQGPARTKWDFQGTPD